MNLENKVRTYTNLLLAEREAAAFVEENREDAEFMAFVRPHAAFCAAMLEALDRKKNGKSQD